MLRLKQIEAVGFKSFCDRERLRFPGTGIAAVVGPNGCGKSNICDAVSWVLGEQSAKSLRGGRMRDVIFAGTRDRKPSGLANVTLTLHDPDGKLASLRPGKGAGQARGSANGSGSREIQVGRKLFSDGKSHYMLNGKIVRLRDVQELFLGTGLGPNHYAIIEQGRIGQLLTARSQDRRTFVEEAAGVTKFKLRRRLAELKLANSQLNLERVHDILQEIKRQARSLQRQAERAARYERYREQLVVAQRMLFAKRHGAIGTELAAVRAEVEEARQELAAATRDVERLDVEFSDQRDRERKGEAQLEEAREELSGLRIKRERLRERLEQQSRAIADNVARQETTGQDLEAVSARAAELQESAAGQVRAIERSEAETGELRRNLEAKEAECRSQQARAATLHAARESVRHRILTTLAALSEAKGTIGKLDEAIARAGTDAAKYRDRLDQARADLAATSQRQDELDVAAAETKRQIGVARSKRDALKEDVARAETRLAELRKAADTHRADVAALAARRDSVREMLRHRAYGTESVKDIFDAIQNSPQNGFRPLGVLADFLDVDPGYEKAVEQFLADDLEHVVVGDWAEAGRGVRLVRDEFAGRAAFLLADPEPPPSAPGSAEAVEGALPLTDHVRLVPGASGAIPCLLPKIRLGYLVEDVALAQGLVTRRPDLYFLLPDGTWYHGDTVQGGRRASSGPLVLKRQLRELTPQLRESERELAAVESEIAQTEELARAARAALQGARHDLQELEKRGLSAEHGLRQAGLRCAELRRAQESCRGEIERIAAERSSAEARRVSQATRLEDLEASYGQLKADTVGLDEDCGRAEATLAGLREERTALQTEAAALDERLRAQRNAQRAATAAAAEQRARLDAMRAQIVRWQEENETFGRSNAGMRLEIDRAESVEARLDAEIAEAVRRLADSRLRTGALIEAVRERRASLEDIRQSSSQKEVSLARRQADMAHLARDCRAELGVEVEALAAETAASVAEEDLDELDERYRAVRAKIERLGPVNVLARKEHRDVTCRLEFLSAQQQDLLDSMRNTKQAIGEIDSASRQKFDAAFSAINVNFREVFATLFGGGTGELRLSDPLNREDSGIEIVAQPPGKRLQNVALLSGGEKSLTVMALLMATFRFQPSPFCILDEVDSQLDEANTIRLRHLIQEMAPETQFVVITHSKTMMEAAETLYGVTMGEAGVSKLVSVRMAQSRIGDDAAAPHADSVAVVA